jgi:sulfite oxidase
MTRIDDPSPATAAGAAFRPSAVSPEHGSGARITVTEQPYNAETPLPLMSIPITPAGAFYVRSNFAVPHVDAAGWKLVVDGAVKRPLALDLDTLRGLRSRSVTVTMECAGNGRALMRRPAPGTQWTLGAAGTANFEGVALRDVLRLAGVRGESVEVLCGGADSGELGDGRMVGYERSMPLSEASRPDVLIAWAMNGAPLPPEHGFPLRLVVPGWYGMASVKWLTRVQLLTRPFDGHFQRERYVYRGEEGLEDETPVTRMRVRSVITAPADGASLPFVPIRVAGAAWSGYGAIRAVELSVDGGDGWSAARLEGAVRRSVVTPWSAVWTPPAPGTYRLIVRARDSAGNRQPLEPVWNELGYGNNVAHRITLRIG